MFGIIPRPLWEKTNPPDAQNRIDLHLRCMLIQKPADKSGPARNILVDNGIGTKWSEKHRGIYAIDHSQWSLITGLAEKGLTPEDITDVIATHLHFDHVGGMTKRLKEDDPSSELIPTFPNAQVYLQRRNWELANDPTEKDQGSYLDENFAIYGDGAVAGRKLVLLDTPSIEPSGVTSFSGPEPKEEEILPGISVFVSHGHTLGMQIVRVSDGKKSISYCADLIPTASHVRIPYIMGYDCYPMFILKEKKIFLDRVASEGGYLFFEHCHRMAATEVVRTKKGGFDHGQSIEI